MTSQKQRDEGSLGWLAATCWLSPHSCVTANSCPTFACNGTRPHHSLRWTLRAYQQLRGGPAAAAAVRAQVGRHMSAGRQAGRQAGEQSVAKRCMGHMNTASCIGTADCMPSDSVSVKLRLTKQLQQTSEQRAQQVDMTAQGSGQERMMPCAVPVGRRPRWQLPSKTQPGFHFPCMCLQSACPQRNLRYRPPGNSLRQAWHTVMGWQATILTSAHERYGGQKAVVLDLGEPAVSQLGCAGGCQQNVGRLNCTAAVGRWGGMPGVGWQQQRNVGNAAVTWLCVQQVWAWQP